MDKPAFDADTPLICEMAGLKCLAHRMPPEDKGFKDKAFAGSVEIDLDPSCKAAAVKQDGFLWQPVKGRASARGKSHIDAGNVVSAAAIGALGSLGGHNHLAGGGLALIVVAVAAGDAAGGVHQNGLMRAAVGAGKQCFRGTALVQACQIAVPKAKAGFAA